MCFTAGCYDALSAKCLQKAGHKGAFVSGYAVGAVGGQLVEELAPRLGAVVWSGGSANQQ